MAGIFNHNDPKRMQETINKVKQLFEPWNAQKGDVIRFVRHKNSDHVLEGIVSHRDKTHVEVAVNNDPKFHGICRIHVSLINIVVETRNERIEKENLEISKRQFQEYVKEHTTVQNRTGKKNKKQTVYYVDQLEELKRKMAEKKEMAASK